MVVETWKILGTIGFREMHTEIGGRDGFDREIFEEGALSAHR